MKTLLRRAALAVVVPGALLFARPAHAQPRLHEQPQAGARLVPSDKELVLEYGATQHVFKRIPKGKLTQGSPVEEAGREADEASRPVSITRDFWMEAGLVSRGDFAAFVEDARYLTEAERGQSGGHGWDGKALVQKKEFTWRNPGFKQTDDHPVVLVTWGDANAYAAWVSRKTGRRVRLPTEAEWEYAARAGTTTPWYAGASEQDALASGWFKSNAGNGTRARGEKGRNPFGLLDMAGNVYEWCRDVYAPYGKGPAVDPEQTSSVPGEPERRVLRGGSWMRDPKRGRSAARYRATPGTRNAENGFRLVVTDEESLAPGMFAPKLDQPLVPPLPFDEDAGPGVRTKPHEPASPGEGSPWALLLAPAAAAGAVVAWLLLRRRGGGANGFATRTGDDGFWVRPPVDARGARVRYDCVVNGTVVTDVVPLDGAEETFVYTGGHPSAIRIVEVVPVTAGSYRQPDARPVSSPPKAPPVSTTMPVRTTPASTTTTNDAFTQGAILNQAIDDVSSWSSSTSSSSSDASSSEPFLGTPRAY